MKELALYKCIRSGPNPIFERLSILTLVDDCCFDELNMHRWKFTKKGYARRVENIGGGKFANFSVHAEVMRICGIAKPSAESTPDHISGDKLDNRVANLRWANRSQQGANRKLVNSAGLPLGVTKRRGRFVAQLTSRSKGVHLHLGTFDTASDAAVAFNNKWREMFPDLAQYRRV